MRVNGVIDSAHDPLPHGHLCWAYQDRSEFRARAQEYVASGVATGLWVEYVGSGSAEQLRTELAGFSRIRGIIGGGGIGVTTVDDFYEFSGHGNAVDPLSTVAMRVAGTQQVLAAGYPGLRVVVDVTALVRTPEQRAAFARWEYLIDRTISNLPVTALCAYDVSELGSAAVAELACLHPVINAGSSSFRLYTDQGADLVLAGEIDFSCTDLFDTTLGRTIPLAPGPDLVIDGRGLEFIDHRGLLAVERHAREHNRNLVLRSTSPTVARLADLLSLETLGVEVVEQ